MATRLYLHNAVQSPPLSPNWASQWELTSSHGFVLSTNDSGDAGSTSYARTGSGGTTDDVANCQLYTDPIPAQLVEGTLTGLVACYKSGSGAAGIAYMIVRVCSANLQTIRGTLLEVTGEAWGTSAVAVAYPSHPSGTSLASVQAQEGDRILLDIGVRKTAGDSSTLFFMFVGAVAGDSDFSAVGQGHSGRTPWIEFSQTLWPANSDLATEALPVSGGTGELDATGGTPDASITTVTATSFAGGDIDVYEPVPITATATATAFLGGDLTDVLFLSDD